MRSQEEVIVLTMGMSALEFPELHRETGAYDHFNYLPLIQIEKLSNLVMKWALVRDTSGDWCNFSLHMGLFFSLIPWLNYPKNG